MRSNFFLLFQKFLHIESLDQIRINFRVLFAVLIFHFEFFQSLGDKSPRELMEICQERVNIAIELSQTEIRIFISKSNS